MAKPKRTIFRVMKKGAAWCTVGVNSKGLFHINKRFAVESAFDWARSRQPSQVLIYARSRKTGRYRIVREYSYGCDSKRRKG